MRYFIALLMLLSLQANAQRKLSQLPVTRPDTGMTVIIVYKVGGSTTDVRVPLDSIASYIGDLTTHSLQQVTNVGRATTNSVAFISPADSLVLSSSAVTYYNDAGGSAAILPHDEAVSTSAVLPPKDILIGYELKQVVSTDADFTASSDKIFILPTLTASRTITYSGTPAHNDKMFFVNHNGTGNTWNLAGWSYIDVNGSSSTAINNIGVYHLIYNSSLGRWVQY